MSELDLLYRKRSSVRQKFNAFLKYFEIIREKYLQDVKLDSKEVIELKIRVEKLELVHNEFDNFQNEIELCCPLKQLEKQYQERASFDDLYCDILAKSKEILEKYDCDDESKSVGHSSGRSNNNVMNGSVPYDTNAIRLPPIRCPTFDGEFDKWLEFKDTFEVLFHNNPALSNIQKFHYLRSCLGEQVSKIIQSLEFAAHNYSDAWTLLCERFDNSRLLVNNHLKSLFGIDNLTKETSSGLRELIDSVNKHLRALKTLNLPTDTWDAMIIYMVSQKLDKNTNREWEQSRNDKSMPTLSAFFEFLKNRADFLETIEMNSSVFRHKDVQVNKKVPYTIFLGKSFERKCNFCKNDHLIYSCDKFLELSVSERWENVKQLKLCSNCLCFGHYSRRCQAASCKLCPGKHSTLLHYKKAETVPENRTVNSNTPNHEPHGTKEHQVRTNVSGTQNKNSFNGSSIICASNKINNGKYVLLSTAMIKIQDKWGQYHDAHAILDSGSQCSFISDSFRKKLGLNTSSVSMSVSGINSVSSNLKSKCDISIKSRINDFEAKLICLIIPKITDSIPSHSLNISELHIPTEITLANPSFNVSRDVDILIGADLFWDTICKEKISLGKNKPYLINTVFGYVISGSVNLPISKTLKCNFVVNDDLQKFWSIEEIPCESPPLNKEEQFCEEYFNKTVSRDLQGKFIVRFPLKSSSCELGESKDLAIKRLIFQEKRLVKNDILKDKYFTFMKEYSDLGHMRKLSDYSIKSFKCFLPHFAVVREDSLTTNVRVVFDASSKTGSGKSLNDIQFSGPSIQNNIFGIMLRFRQHTFVVMADIAKMYRQILIHPDERHLQNIVWRTDANQNICSYELQTVTYGTSSAPYLAIKCIKTLAAQNKAKYPKACELIDRDMYVDDLITGFDNVEQGIVTCNDISKILKSASFSLRKWASNSPKILQSLEDTSDVFSVLELGENEKIKILGIQWLSHPDLLSFKVLDSFSKSSATKRSLLSSIAKIYDPLGLVSPCIILVKTLIQKLWSLKLEWDDLVPPEISEKWETFYSQLSVLNNLKIPRHVMCHKPIDMQIHGFSDASMDAYSAVVYVRTVDCMGKVTVRLLCSKTKVAPVSVLTVPRLELCGALALARLMKQVGNSLISKFKMYFWCDSQIVLSWLKTDANKLQVFVSNRVAEIQRLCDPSYWSYVNTKQNPADIASRGMYPDALYESDMWWNGPCFLYKEADWPRNLEIIKHDEIPEIKESSKVFLTVSESLINFDRFSNINRVIRSLAYCLRFTEILKTKTRINGELSVQELENSIQYLIKFAQRESFSKEISILKGDKSLNNTHRLLSLNPFLDSNGLLRVGGRLKHSELSYNEKHQLLLDSKHRITKLIFRAEHLRLQHAGPQFLLFSVRQKYWPVAGMNVAKMTVRTCVKCFRAKPKSINSVMADLPRQRVQIAKPFSVTGVDYAGPMSLRDRKGRPYKTYKAYICLFICFATKCVHIELVTDLTTEAFIATFRRFAARRGTPNHLYSDNGSNFVGAQKELFNLYKFLENSENEFIKICAQEKIKWHFIPPGSPNFGGLWESNIKAIKNHLCRVIGNSILTYEEYYTLLVQVEAILNSRPLYPMSSDPHDLMHLTPSHLLIGQPLVMPPDPLYEENLKLNRLSRFQLLQQLSHSFWKKWSNFYLSELQKRHKWKVGSSNVKVGDLVVIKNDNLPPCKWILGRIIEIHPGEDGHVRVVTIKTLSGTYKRAVSKICPLPQ